MLILKNILAGLFFIASIKVCFSQKHNYFDNNLISFCEELNQLKITEMDSLGFTVLQCGIKNAILDKKVIKGSCWDFVNYIYNEAGFIKNRLRVYSSKKSGPFASLELLKPGDWVYHINHSFIILNTVQYLFVGKILIKGKL